MDNNNLMDNILRELHYKISENYVDISSLYGLGTNLTMSDINIALSELIAKNYVQKVDGGVRITELGESFCKISSFCCNSKPIVI
ncbi:MAG: hypothetical protein J5542_02360 [Bacteroidales bacterium]|nr:hypothetical protein [Bacteroidales bacterium]